MLLTIEEATIGFVKAIGEDEGSCVRCFKKKNFPTVARFEFFHTVYMKSYQSCH